MALLVLFCVYFFTAFLWHLEAMLLSFSRSVVSNSSQPHGLQHARLPCPSPSPGVCPSSCPSHRWLWSEAMLAFWQPSQRILAKWPQSRFKHQVTFHVLSSRHTQSTLQPSIRGWLRVKSGAFLLRSKWNSPTDVTFPTPLDGTALGMIFEYRFLCFASQNSCLPYSPRERPWQMEERNKRSYWHQHSAFSVSEKLPKGLSCGVKVESPDDSAFGICKTVDPLRAGPGLMALASRSCDPEHHGRNSREAPALKAHPHSCRARRLELCPQSPNILRTCFPPAQINKA